MKIAKKALLYALKIALVVMPKASASLPILRYVKISGPDQKIYATNLETYIEAPIEIADFHHTISIEGDLPEKDVLEGLLKAQLLQVAALDGAEVAPSARNSVITKAIWKEWRRQAEAETKTNVIEEVFCVNAKDLYSIVLSLEDETVQISITESEKNLLFGSVQPQVGIGPFRTLFTEPNTDFPDALVFESDEVAEISISKDDIKKILPVFSRTATENLSGVFFDSENDNVFSTDGHRLHVVHGQTVARSVIVPQTCLVLAGKLSKENINIFTDGELIQIRLENAIMMSRAVNTVFPDYLTIIREPENHVKIKKEDIIKVLTQSQIVARGSHEGISLTFNGKISLKANNPDMGEYNQVDIPLASGNIDPEITIGMNVKFLIDSFRGAEDKTKVTIDIQSDHNPVQIQYGNFTSILMPMRTTT